MSRAKKARTENAKGGSLRGTAEHEQELLDEALIESFPASDPPAVTMPHERTHDTPAAPERRGGGRGPSAQRRRAD